VVVELPKPPWHRRFGVLFLVANLLVAAILVAAVIALWPPATPRPDQPATTVASQPGQVGPKDAGPATILPSSTTARREPGVLWQQRGHDAAVGERFQAPGRWRVVWSFDCRNFAAYGGGNFKLSGAGSGAFDKVAVQRFGVRGRGSLLVTGGGRGRLSIESVCDRWVVKAVAA
jgi:hypothetical protein